MSDEPLFIPGKKPPAPRVAEVGELLFEFHVERTHKFYRVELRDHGAYGVEAQCLDPVDVVFSRTFSPHLDLTRTSRAMAIAWAEQERKALIETNDEC
jgi:hypothetical protein